VLGYGADLSAVAALADLDETRAAAAVAELAGAEIVRAEPPLGFVHPVVGAAVRRDVPLGERELQHGRAARLLADAGAPVEQVAAYLLGTPGRGEAWGVETPRRAATAARRKGAADSAVAYLARALAEPPSPDARPELLLPQTRDQQSSPARIRAGRSARRTSGRSTLSAAYHTAESPSAAHPR